MYLSSHIPGNIHEPNHSHQWYNWIWHIVPSWVVGMLIHCLNSWTTCLMIADYLGFYLYEIVNVLHLQVREYALAICFIRDLQKLRPYTMYSEPMCTSENINIYIMYNTLVLHKYCLIWQNLWTLKFGSQFDAW